MRRVRRLRSGGDPNDRSALQPPFIVLDRTYSRYSARFVFAATVLQPGGYKPVRGGHTVLKTLKVRRCQKCQKGVWEAFGTFGTSSYRKLASHPACESVKPILAFGCAHWRISDQERSASTPTCECGSLLVEELYSEGLHAWQCNAARIYTLATVHRCKKRTGRAGTPPRGERSEFRSVRPH
jgi:hypothetical protein